MIYKSNFNNSSPTNVGLQERNGMKYVKRKNANDKIQISRKNR